MKKMIYLPLICLLVSCETTNKVPQIALSVNPLFSDHMVLQQQEEVAFWGTYTPNEKITVSGSWGKKATAIADKNGHWKTRLTTTKAGGPFEVKIITKDSTLLLKDVMLGEVWLASGQSNMEMPLNGFPPNDSINNSAKEISNANYAGIRMLTVSKNYALSPANEFNGEWIVCAPESASNLSATAYFFATKLNQELNVPIGIIHASWGGTVAEAWTSRERLKKLGDFDETLAIIENPQNERLTKEWYDQWDAKKLPITDEDWKAINFNDTALSQKEYEDKNWKNIELPARIDEFDNGEIDGAIWLRKTIVIEDISANYILTLGAVDDMDATYINGKKIGEMAGAGKYNLKRTYTIPKELLKKGENTIAIRVIDTGGPGSVQGPLELSNENGTTITVEGSWKFLMIAEIYGNTFYVYDIKKINEIKRPNIIPVTPNTPTALYNAMIHPLAPFTIKGTIWYQGESNVGRAEQYTKLFPSMIEDWRTKWDRDFPFYFVQIAPFNYGNGLSPALRDAQRKSLKTKNTGMAIIMDLGNAKNIHPANKQDVGNRLARLALANDYNKTMVASGPLYKSHIVSGNKMIVEFDYTGSGLMVKGSQLSEFEIAGADKNFVTAKATISDNKIEVYAASITTPEYVRYAWKDYIVPTLFNKEGLPASSFTTEID